MKTAEHIIETVDKLVRKYHTRDPYELCQLLGIKIHYYDLQKKLKGFFYYQSRQKNIVIDHNVNGILERILVAHELGHAVLHTKIAMMHGFQEMEVFDDRSIEENEANFFAAELLLEDGKVLECLSEHTFFETAKMLYVPAALRRASHIQDVRQNTESGMSLDELSQNPVLDDTIRSYYNNPVQVAQVGSYYVFQSDGRHRTLAAQSLDTYIPVLVTGSYTRND